MSEQIFFFKQHLWLLCAAFWLLYPRLSFRWIPNSRPDRQKHTELLKIVGVFVGVASIALWFIQLASGLPSDPFILRWQAPQRSLGLMVVVGFWISICWWGFLRGGTQMIADTYSLKLIVVRMVFAGFAIFSILQTVSFYIVPGGVLGRS